MSKIAIELKEVNIFRQQIPVLKAVNFKINEGEFVYLLGKTGSGKTSLLQTLYAEIPLQTGEGQMNEVNLNELTYKNIPAFRKLIYAQVKELYLERYPYKASYIDNLDYEDFGE